MSLTATEKKMWKDVSNLVLPKNSQIITALNREKLPVFANTLKQRSDYIALKPSYSRSSCWTVTQDYQILWLCVRGFQESRLRCLCDNSRYG